MYCNSIVFSIENVSNRTSDDDSDTNWPDDSDSHGTPRENWQTLVLHNIIAIIIAIAVNTTNGTILLYALSSFTVFSQYGIWHLQDSYEVTGATSPDHETGVGDTSLPGRPRDLATA